MFFDKMKILAIISRMNSFVHTHLKLKVGLHVKGAQLKAVKRHKNQIFFWRSACRRCCLILALNKGVRTFLLIEKLFEVLFSLFSFVPTHLHFRQQLV